MFVFPKLDTMNHQPTAPTMNPNEELYDFQNKWTPDTDGGIITLRSANEYKNRWPPEVEAGSSMNNSSNQVFDFKNKCIFCAEDASDAFIKDQEQYEPKKRVRVCFVKREKTRGKLIETFSNAVDQRSLTVLDRLMRVPDLVAVNARYHFVCNNKYRSNVKLRAAEN